MKVQVALLLFLVSSAASAEMTCAADRQAKDARECAIAMESAAYSEMDEGYLTAVDELRALATSNPAFEHSEKVLTEAQQFWRQYTIKNCDVFTAHVPVVAEKVTRFATCMAAHDVDRTAELRRFVAELEIVKASLGTKPPIPVTYNCSFTEGEIATTNARDACVVKALAKRCNGVDSCHVRCLVSGGAKNIGGGCYHVCRGVNRLRWTMTPEAAACLSK